MKPWRFILLAFALGALAWGAIIGGAVLAAHHVNFAKGGFW